MYVQIIFRKDGEIIDLSDPSYKHPVCYTLEEPIVCQILPETAAENKLVSPYGNGDLYYHIDCGELDRDTVDNIVTTFIKQNLKLESFGYGNLGCYSTTRISNPADDGMTYIDKLSAMLVNAKREHAKNKQPPSQSLMSNQNLLFAASGLALGIAATALIKSMKPM